MHPDDTSPPAHSPSPAPADIALPPLQWGMTSLLAGAGADLRWLWHGYLAPGVVTLLSSQWKTGKTTLASVLLARMKAGGSLAGLPVAAGRAVVVSEEPAEQWVRRGGRLDLEEHVGWYCRPFRGRPRPGQWEALLERVAEEAGQRGVGLAVVDPLAAFYPGKSENDACAMLDALAPLQRLAARGLAVLALHHPAKKEDRGGPSGRGSGALLGCADILVEMRWYRRAGEADRRRRLVALSRFDETPRQLVVELNAEGTDYLSHGDFAAAEFASHWGELQELLRPAERKLTRREIYRAWPAEGRPDPGGLYRWLRRAVAEGRLRQDGEGRGGRPFRYWLEENEGRWRQGPWALAFMPEPRQPPGGTPG
jgi:AAA domain